MPSEESDRHSRSNDQAHAFSGANGPDLVRSAFDYLRRSLSRDGNSSGTPTVARQKEDLCEWASSLGLLLTASDLPSKTVRGGQEHDLFHDITHDRYFKVTRHGIFGLSPGIELALVSSSKDAREFHLWEATPLEYLERLYLHNLLVPGLNSFQGVIVQADGDMAIVTSQPRFDIVAVTEKEIDEWFATQGFKRVTKSGYYRLEDNLGVFDAHEKNVVRAGELLIPFDVIPCRPEGGFLKFIEDTLAVGHAVNAVRKVSTTPAQTSFDPTL